MLIVASLALVGMFFAVPIAVDPEYICVVLVGKIVLFPFCITLMVRDTDVIVALFGMDEVSNL